ncbi:MAG: ParB/RepB/Spo0J family partition protein [Candidatus Eisenbacteria bacterium]
MGKAFELEEIEVGKLQPNAWNPNRMSEEMYYKLKQYVKREGLVEPIVVRCLGDGYQILGGYHRWKIARDLGYETVPCAVVDLDDRRAKILSVNLNEMKGQSVSSLLSELVHDLSQELTLDDLESQLPYSEAELKDALELMKIPDGLEAYLDEEVAKAERERPHILSFVVEDVETVEKAIEKASQANGGLTRGKSLVEIARAYVSEVSAS